jgi:hypothetical protein
MRTRSGASLRGLLLVAAVVQGCSSNPDIINPTGNCSGGGDGSRAGDHSSEDTWLPDCENPLAREYYRVFARSGTSAYTMPRLDGASGLQPACMDDEHELAPLTQKYLLCESASSSADVERVNDMLPEDALAITHFLHERLKFDIGPGDRGISPSPFRTDVVDACELRARRSEELEAICERERARLRAGTDEGFTYDGQGAVQLVARLNELYGIDD